MAKDDKPKTGRDLMIAIGMKPKASSSSSMDHDDEEEDAPESESGDEEHEPVDDAQLEAMQAFMDAVTKGDAEAAVHAFRAVKESC